jgi:hypothetical protein
MSTLDISHAAEHESVPGRRLAVAMAMVIPVVALMEAVYYFGGIAGTPDDTPARAALVATVVGALAAGAIWRFGRDACRGGRGAGLMAVLAAVSTLGFWIGVTFPVAVAAVLFGRAALDAGGVGRGRTAVAVGIVALGLATVLCALGAS